VRDIARSRAFYERALEPGIRLVESSQGPHGFVTADRGDLCIKEQETSAGPVHIAFAAQTARPLMPSTPRPWRQEGSTTESLGCGLGTTRRTTPHSFSTRTGTTSKLSSAAIA